MYIIMSLLSILLSNVARTFAWPVVNESLMKDTINHEQLFQINLSLDQVLTTSLEMAATNCRENFKWRRWNCPSSDFYLRHATHQQNHHLPDREDAYVNAITTAAILYTITKNCSSGLIVDCGGSGCGTFTTPCSDNISASEALYNQLIGTDIVGTTFLNSIRQHNHKVITNLVRSSMKEHCSIESNRTKKCRRFLRPFAETAHDIRRMYDKSLQLSLKGSNSQVVWKNVPLDTLVFVKDSPNFCEPEALPDWNGMRGRRCVQHVTDSRRDSEISDNEEYQSCHRLCRACGYRVRAQKVLSYRPCNCRHTWGGDFPQMQCDPCVTAETQYSCY